MNVDIKQAIQNLESGTSSFEDFYTVCRDTSGYPSNISALSVYINEKIAKMGGEKMTFIGMLYDVHNSFHILIALKDGSNAGIPVHFSEEFFNEVLAELVKFNNLKNDEN